MKLEKKWFHVDLDAFFASVEQHDHPEWKGLPVIVGGEKGDRRAVVSTASYEARKYGVHSAMPLSKAVELCPKGIFIRGRHDRYAEVSSIIMGIFGNYTPTVKQMSIDEAFLDMTGTEKLFGDTQEAAARIKDEVLKKTGLTVSIGVSRSMYVAKIASGYRKPDGLTEIHPGKEEDFMLSLPLEKLWGAGSRTQAKLKSTGITTTKALHGKSMQILKLIFGESGGTFLYNAVRGNMDMEFGKEAKNHSISTERTFDFDITDRYVIETKIMELAESVLWEMHRQSVRSRTAFLKIRYDDFRTVSVQETSEFPILNSDDLFERCSRLFRKKFEDGKGIRLLGVGVDNCEKSSSPMPQLLFEDKNQRMAKLEKAIFEMENRNPELKVKKARLIQKGEM